jgi:hypothetical protein
MPIEKDINGLQRTQMNSSGQSDALAGGFGALGTWWRAQRYEVGDGVVRPVRGARIVAYDPWEDYRAARSGWGGGGGQAPYETLLELLWTVRLLPARQGEAPRLDPASEQALAVWCASHGLLGLLPHEAEVASLAPTWMAAPDPPAGFRLIPIQRMYAWGALGWRQSDPGGPWTEPMPIAAALAQDGQLVPPEQVPASLQPPLVLGRTLGEGAWLTQALGAAWGPYFPDVPADEQQTHAYPLPLTDAFWDAYAEPLEAFLGVATLFSDTLHDLGPELREDEEAGAYVRRRERAERAFFSLAASVHPAFGEDPPGRYARAWQTKSLLASYAMMAYLDLTAGKRVRACEEDGRPFVSGAHQARYCSDRCRQRAVKRAYRQRLRERAAHDDPIPQPAEDNHGSHD